MAVSSKICFRLHFIDEGDEGFKQTVILERIKQYCTLKFNISVYAYGDIYYINTSLYVYNENN
jgi:hypothetical protein